MSTPQIKDRALALILPEPVFDPPNPLANPLFASHQAVIDSLAYLAGRERMEKFRCPAVRKFSESPYQEILDSCQAHRALFRQGINGKKAVLTLTHPLYLFLADRKSLQDSDLGTKVQAANYQRRLNQTLRTLHAEEAIDVLLIEEPDHYAAQTSRLLEQGLVQDVFFTEFDTGALLTEQEYQGLEDVPCVYVAGGYVGSCLTTSLYHITETIGTQKVVLLPELLVTPPASHLQAIPPSVTIDPRLCYAENVCADRQLYSKLLSDLDIFCPNTCSINAMRVQEISRGRSQEAK